MYENIFREVLARVRPGFPGPPTSPMPGASGVPIPSFSAPSLRLPDLTPPIQKFASAIGAPQPIYGMGGGEQLMYTWKPTPVAPPPAPPPRIEPLAPMAPYPGMINDGSGENGQSPSSDPQGPDGTGGQAGGTPGQSSGVNSAGDVGGQMGTPGMTANVATGLAGVVGGPVAGLAAATGLSAAGHPPGGLMGMVGRGLAMGLDAMGLTDSVGNTAANEGLTAAAAPGLASDTAQAVADGTSPGIGGGGSQGGMGGGIGGGNTEGSPAGDGGGVAGGIGGPAGPGGIGGTDAAGNPGVADGGPAGSGPAGGGEGSCFITEAATAGGEADDGRALTVLRWFRDNVMAGTPEGQAQIRAYYAGAPRIVRGINARSDAKQVWSRLNSELIQPAVAAVESGDFQLAHILYADLVDEASHFARGSVAATPSKPATPLERFAELVGGRAPS